MNFHGLSSYWNKITTLWSPETIVAVVRVTIEPARPVKGNEQDFSVSIEPRRCPSLSQQMPKGKGKISPGIRKEFDETFPKELSACIGVPEQARIQEANDHIGEHAEKLKQVLCGEAVWGENSQDWQNWWRELVNHKHSRLLVIELALCDEMRKYIWESLLLRGTLASHKVVIVRMRLGDISQPQSFQEVTDPVWMVLFSNPKRGDGGGEDISNLEISAQDIVDNLSQTLGRGDPIRQIPQRVRSGQLDVIRQTCDCLRNQSIALFLYVGHGQVQRDTATLVLESERPGRRDSVDVTRLRDAFGDHMPAVFLMIACWLGTDVIPSTDTSGKRAQLIDELLDMSKLIVAMQLPLSTNAAQRFLKGFSNFTSEKLRDPKDICSVVKIARGVASARRHMRSGPYSHIEAATPVIYTRVPTEIPQTVRLPPIQQLVVILVLVLSIVFIPFISDSLVKHVQTLTPFQLISTPTATAVTPPPSPPCVELDIETFIIDGKIVDATTTHTTTLDGARPELIIKANVIARPPDCQQQLTVRWKVRDDNEDKDLGDFQFQDFLEVAHHAPPVGKAETISVFIQDKNTHAEAHTYLILRSVSQEESKGES